MPEYDKMDAIIRVHFKIDPGQLNDEEYYKLYQQWIYVENIRKSSYKDALKEVVQDVLKQIKL